MLAVNAMFEPFNSAKANHVTLASTLTRLKSECSQSSLHFVSQGTKSLQNPLTVCQNKIRGYC